MEKVQESAAYQNLMDCIRVGITTVIFCFIIAISISVIFEAKKKKDRRTLITGVMFVLLFAGIAIGTFIVLTFSIDKVLRP